MLTFAPLPNRRWLASCWLMLAALFTAMIAGPAEAQPNRNRFADRLPAKFKSLSTDEARELGLMAELNVLWIGDVREIPGADPVVDLFGPFGGQRTELDEDEASGGYEENSRGLIVLSVLGRDQLNSLFELVREQKPKLRDYFLARAKTIARFRQLRDREVKETAVDARNFDKEVIELGKLMGECEARVAIDQAWAFLQFESKFSQEQKNYIRMLRDKPDAFKLDAPAVQTARELMLRLEEPYPLLMQDIAAKMASYLSGTAEQNIAQRPHRDATLLGKTSRNFPPVASRFLEVLNPPQQDRMLVLLAAERPYTNEYVKKRIEFASALDGLKKVKELNDKNLLKIGAQMGELEARVALFQARAFEQVRLSLAPAQRFFIEQNLVGQN
jgi:hypothetical protein